MKYHLVISPCIAIKKKSLCTYLGQKGSVKEDSMIRIVKVSQSCPTLCDPMNYTVHGNLQAGILEWVAFPFSRGSS